MTELELQNLVLQKLDKSGLDILIGWAKNEGWNPGLHDAEAFWNADPDGFVGYFHQNELIAGGAIVSYGGEFGFMGLFIVHPEFRGQGIGQKLWFERRGLLLNRLKPESSIGMDGVVAMQPFYEKGGFHIVFRDERYERLGEPFEVHQSISVITEEDLDSIHAYDLACFGFDRSKFLESWLSLPNHQTFKYSDQTGLKGFAVLRKTGVGFKIGPLFAENEKVAEELYKACLNSAQGEPVYLDIPVVNSAAVALIKKFEAKYVFECARMYHGKPPKVDINKIFGITTFELG